VSGFRTHVIPGVLEYVGERGVDVASLLRTCGLPADAATRPFIELPLARLHGFFEQAARAADDDALGLHVGARLSRAPWDVLQLSFLSAPDLRAALQRVARLAPLFNDRTTIRVHDDGEPAIDYRIEGEPLGLSRHGNELILAILLERARAATAQTIVPRACWVAHPRPREPGPLFALVGRTDITFGAGATGFRMSAQDAALPLRTADPVLLDVLDRLTERPLAPVRARRGVSARVAGVLAGRPGGEVPPLAVVARALAMSVRSLQRALAGEATTYRTIVDQVRRIEACELLAAGLDVDEVARRLGYERSALVRALGRWRRDESGE
jgi:AraC-like DNA-binding protein